MLTAASGLPRERGLSIVDRAEPAARLETSLPGPEQGQPAALVPALLLAEHAAFVATLACHSQAKALRRRGAGSLLAAHPDLLAWMSRPAAGRLAEVRRLQAWPFLSWCFATGRLRPDLDLLVGKGKGGHFTTWLALHQEDAKQARDAARSFSWSAPWQLRITDNALPLACLITGTTLGQLNTVVLDDVEAQIASSVMLTRIGRVHLTAQHHGVRALAYQLRLIDEAPVHPNTRSVSPAERAAAIAQPELRRAVGRYLSTIATTVRPKTVEGRAASLRTFCDWLDTQHPHISSLRQLTREHLEQFLAFDAHRPGRGNTRRDRISVGHHARTVVDLRGFFDDLAAWDWAERPRRCCCTAPTSPGSHSRCRARSPPTSTPP